MSVNRSSWCIIIHCKFFSSSAGLDDYEVRCVTLKSSWCIVNEAKLNYWMQILGNRLPFLLILQVLLTWMMMKLCVWLGLVDVLLVRRPRKALRSTTPRLSTSVSLLHTTNTKCVVGSFWKSHQIFLELRKQTSGFWRRKPDLEAFQTCQVLSTCVWQFLEIPLVCGYSVSGILWKDWNEDVLQ